jgi:hypothetical protein
VHGENIWGGQNRNHAVEPKEEEEGRKRMRRRRRERNNKYRDLVEKSEWKLPLARMELLSG